MQMHTYSMQLIIIPATKPIAKSAGRKDVGYDIPGYTYIQIGYCLMVVITYNAAIQGALSSAICFDCKR